MHRGQEGMHCQMLGVGDDGDRYECKVLMPVEHAGERWLFHRAS